MAEEPTLRRMQVVEAMDALVRGVRVPLDLGVYDVGPLAEGMAAPEVTASMNASGWVLESGYQMRGVLNDDEMTEAERVGRIKWLS